MSFDETYDDMLHGEFSARGKHEARAAADTELVACSSRGRHAAPEETAEGRRGLQRHRTAALIGAGGMACAAAGAFLGGLGGYFSILPAAAHPVDAATVTRDLPLAQAISAAPHSSAGSPVGRGTAAVTAAEFSKTFGSLTEGISPFGSLTSPPFGDLANSGLPGLGDRPTGPGGGGTGPVGGGSGGNPGVPLGGLVPTLDGVVADLTSTLQGLPSLPLPTGSLPTTGPAGTGVTSSSPVVSALSPATGGFGSAGASLPQPTTTPSTAPSGTPTGASTPTTTSSSGLTTVNVPLPVSPPVTTPTLTVGGLSVGVNGAGSTSGLTLRLP